MRSALGLLAGIVVAGLVVAVIEAAGHALLTGDAVFGTVLLAYALGAAAGSSVAFVVIRRKRAWVPAAICLLLAALALQNVTAFPHPVWFAPAAAAAIVLGGWATWWRPSAVTGRTSGSRRTGPPYGS